MVFWDKRSLELVDLEVGLFFVSCRFRNVEDGFLCTFPGIYGPVLSSIREDFWDFWGLSEACGGVLSALGLGGGGGGL